MGVHQLSVTAIPPVMRQRFDYAGRLEVAKFDLKQFEGEDDSKRLEWLGQLMSQTRQAGPALSADDRESFSIGWDAFIDVATSRQLEIAAEWLPSLRLASPELELDQPFVDGLVARANLMKSRRATEAEPSRDPKQAIIDAFTR